MHDAGTEAPTMLLFFIASPFLVHALTCLCPIRMWDAYWFTKCTMPHLQQIQNQSFGLRGIQRNYNLTFPVFIKVGLLTSPLSMHQLLTEHFFAKESFLIRCLHQICRHSAVESVNGTLVSLIAFLMLAAENIMQSVGCSHWCMSSINERVQECTMCHFICSSQRNLISCKFTCNKKHTNAKCTVVKTHGKISSLHANDANIVVWPCSWMAVRAQTWFLAWCENHP